MKHAGRERSHRQKDAACRTPDKAEGRYAAITAPFGTERKLPIAKQSKSMRFLIDSKELTAGVLSVIKAIPVRTTMQILEGIYIEATGTTVRLMCSDLMLEKECLLAATVEEEGRAIVPAKLFSEVMRRLPDAMAEVNIQGSAVDISCGRVQMSIQSIDYEEFPEMRFYGDTFTLKMDRAECRDLILQTVFATAQDDSKPILTGVLLELGDSITAVATDAYQFAMRRVPLASPTPEKSTVIPAKSLIEIARMMDETENDAELTFTRTHVKVDIGHTRLTARLLDGDYIAYRQILPKEYKTRALVNREEMMKAIDRAQLMAREGNNNIVIKFGSNKIQINANSFVGKICEEIDAQIIGEDIEIAFNPKYCMNVLKNIPDETVYFDLLTGISPCVVRPVQGDRYYYLIVPVRIYSQY